MAQNTYRLTISYVAAGQFCQNVLHYQFDDALFANAVAAAAALNNAFDTHCTASLKAAISTFTQILSYKCRKVSGPGGFEAVKLFTSSDVGTRTGDLSVSGLAPLIRFITNAIPPVTGHMYLPGISDSDTVDGDIQAGYFTVLEALATKLDDSLTLTGGGAPTATPGVWRTKPVKLFVPTHVAVVFAFLSSQRRRQRPA